MRKVILIGIGALALAAAAPLASGGTASASKLVVAMRDPRLPLVLRWRRPQPPPVRQVGHPDQALSASLNLDEAALIIKGPRGTVKEKVGATLTLKARGLYKKITMVEAGRGRQPPPPHHQVTRA